MKRAAFYTLGCKVNQYETEALVEIFQKNGYNIVPFEEVADVYIINTCTVTNLSDRKSRQMIRRAKGNNKDSMVAVVGCYAQTAPEEILSIPEVDIVVGTKDKSKIIEHVNKFQNENTRINTVSDIMRTREYEEFQIDVYKDRTRAFIKVQDGCNQFCSYCIIPYARGPIRSRAMENVIGEIRKIASAGFKEVVLTGIHLASYGKDFKTYSLIDLIKGINEIDGIERIRLGSLEPTIITKDFISELKKMEKLCPHYHVSLQSGCDGTLKRMNRKYSTTEYKYSIELLRENIKDVAVTTDVMTGFPGETEEEFETTYRFLEDIKFSSMHVFKYSRRKGTPASQYQNQIPSIIKEERSKRLVELSQKCSLEYNMGFVNRIMPVLFEQVVKDKFGYIEGHTKNYIRVLCQCEESIKGSIRDVVIKGAFNDYTIGNVIRKE